MAGIRNSHAKPPVQKEAAMAADIIAMVETLDRGSLRGLRDRAILLVGFAGGLRRSEIVGLELKADQTEDGRGWIEITSGRAASVASAAAGSGATTFTYPSAGCTTIAAASSLSARTRSSVSAFSVGSSRSCTA